MERHNYDLVVIGGGPAGLAAALSARENGAENVLILERDKELGGILNQCIHNGFGLHYFKEELTGPEYARRFVKKLEDTDIHVQVDTMVLEITQNREIHCVSSQYGYRVLEAGAIVLAMGCRERTRDAIAIPGDRPAGILTAGAAQRYVNMEGYMVGKRVVVLGSGDIGLIMARRMTLEGAKVLACVELMPYSGGLARNITQCLEDFDIPLYLSHTITEIRGRERVNQVVVAQVDEDKNLVPGSEFTLDCDTLLLSVGLIPENELSKSAGIHLDPRSSGPVVWENMETSVPGIFACGNVVHVHDLVDFVTAESIRAGAAAGKFSAGKGAETDHAVLVQPGEEISYTVPQKLRPANLEKAVDVFFRVRNVYQDCAVTVRDSVKELARYRRERVAPGEMERIVLPKVILDKAEGDLTLALERSC